MEDYSDLMKDITRENEDSGAAQTGQLILAQAYPELAPARDSSMRYQKAAGGLARALATVRQYSSLAPVPGA